MEFKFSNINNLSNKEILDIFRDDDISDEIKNTIVNEYHERINRLPNGLFIEVLPFITKPNILLDYYQEKLSTLSYTELVSLTYDVHIDPYCLFTIIELDIFKKYLIIEKESNKNDKLQICFLSSKLFSSKNNSDLTSICNEICNLIGSRDVYSEELSTFIEIFLDEICDNIKIIDEYLINNCLSILAITISKNMLLTKKMLKFYISYRLRNLDLLDVCENISISNDHDSDTIAYYYYPLKKMNFYYNYLIDSYSSRLNGESITNIGYLNQIMIYAISHELSHVIDKKNFQNISGDSSEHSFSDYYYKCEMIRSHLGQKIYDNDHDLFIDENKADLFAIFDTSIQINTIFKGSFSSDNLQFFARNCAAKIISFYTKIIDDQLFIISPSEKFDKYANSIEGISFKNSVDISYGNDIYNDLLLGMPIPIEILVRILDIAKGNVVTTDLNSEIIKAIEEYIVDKEKNFKK